VTTLVLVLETVVVAFSFVQLVSMHEIIRSYDRPVGDDPAYVYLICVGLFVGQTVECASPPYIRGHPHRALRLSFGLRMVGWSAVKYHLVTLA